MRENVTLAANATAHHVPLPPLHAPPLQQRLQRRRQRQGARWRHVDAVPQFVRAPTATDDDADADANDGQVDVADAYADLMIVVVAAAVVVVFAKTRKKFGNAITYIYHNYYRAW